MANVIDVANYILEISREESEDEECELISNLKLQKLIYFCQGYSFAFFNKPLFNDAIEAWMHGPVCPKLYHMLKGYGSLPITASIEPDKISLNDKEKQLIRMIYDTYGQYSAMGLRKITHEEGPWKDTQTSTVISYEALSKYFTERIEVTSADHPWTDEERKKAKEILEEAEANGEIDLSQFCVPMGT
ncbi:Panacea domain-containing protein [Treponema sp. R6D11]